MAVSIQEHSSCQGGFCANQLVPLSLPWWLSAYALGQVRTHAGLPWKCHEGVPLQTLGLFGQELKQTAVTMTDSGSPEIFFSFFSLFPLPIWILTVCKQIHSFLKTAVSRITRPQAMFHRREWDNRRGPIGESYLFKRTGVQRTQFCSCSYYLSP